MLSQTETTLHAQQMMALKDIVNFARNHSAYYAELYRTLPQQGWQLEDLPLVDLHDYWQGSAELKTWHVLTGDVEDGIVFKTGGTTGASKLSVFTREEWLSMCRSFSRSIGNHLHAGDRVGNLFYAGDLYSSFILIHDAMMHMDVKICEYPFGGTMETSKLYEQLLQLKITVLQSPPSTLMLHAARLLKSDLILPDVRLVLFGCESLFPGQIELLKKVMPNAQIISIGYASVDAGLIGASRSDCQSGEHYPFIPETILEILDEETGKPVTEPGKSGQLVVTSLDRKLMPVIRYPVGDRAAWCVHSTADEPKYVLQGRSSLGQRIRVGYASIYPDELNQIIMTTVGQQQWQLILDQVNDVDRVIIKIAFRGGEELAKSLVKTLYAKDQILRELRDRGQLILEVKWCDQEGLICNPRTGKLQRVNDLRQYNSSGQA